MFTLIAGAVVGVVILGWVYHRYTTQTTAALNEAATVVNAEINNVKAKVANTTTANT